jgi:hypothetical protein
LHVAAAPQEKKEKERWLSPPRSHSPRSVIVGKRRRSAAPPGAEVAAFATILQNVSDEDMRFLTAEDLIKILGRCSMELYAKPVSEAEIDANIALILKEGLQQPRA